MTVTRKIGALFALAALLPGCGSGSDEPLRFPSAVVQRLDQTIATRMQNDDLPGVAVGVWVPGRGEYVVARGKANLVTSAARTIDAPFRIASITKTFTATVILQLVDEKKLSLSDALAKWYPAFPNADKITVNDLLRMRSGIPDSLDDAFLVYYLAHPDTAITPEEIIQRSAERVSEFTPPDQTTKYTNVNYILLQEIIRKVSGKDISVQVAERIFKPLGMTHSVYPTNSDFPGPNRGYVWEPTSGKFVDRTILNPAPAGGAGAIISTLSDLRIYAKALYTGTLLKPETQKTRLETQNIAGLPAFVGYGAGIVKIGKFYGHNGTLFGFSSEMFYLPEKDAVIVINVNRLDLDDKSKSANLFFEIAKILFPNDVNW